MLGQQLDPREFESAVELHWRTGRFVCRAPETAARLLQLARRRQVNAHYAGDAPHLGFSSQWLVGVPGRPGAIHIEAPPEARPGGPLRDLNRQPHQHDTGRIALVTRGNAMFHVRRRLPDGALVIVDCPVRTGHVLFWPAWTPHTFDAGCGFSLVSAMAKYVSPAADGFVSPLSHAEPDPDRLGRMDYAGLCEGSYG